MDATPSPPDRWQRLLHRWFVQYNPIYLVSAMLVLGGMMTASRGLAHDGSLYGPLGIAAIAELYAFALIAGAAVLTRIGQRRPAVLLALITILYEGDLTLHTETCAFLGVVGVVASAAWVALFVVKLRALAWALDVVPTWRALATATLGALGLAIGPHVISSLDPRAMGGILALFVFALGSLCPRGPLDAVTPRPSRSPGSPSTGPLDDWGFIVFSRVVRAAWILWAVLLALHLVFWSTQRQVHLAATLPALTLLAMHHIERESRAWLAIVGLVVIVGLVAPADLSVVALLASLACVRRALRSDAHVSPAERVRLACGGLFAIHLSAWTMAWSGGAFPDHVAVLDLALLGGVILLAWRARARAALLPLGVLGVHGAVTSGLVPPPRTLFQYGMTAVALGFVLLVGSVAASYRLRRYGDDMGPPPS
ncbi:MAG: hypothetical protein JST00_45625 [Deltaproteobacteria bacterium]|nr:hypothetical protein [Deltaproteobacteria bacterium]